MQIKEGGTYLTKSGHVVSCVQDVAWFDRVYPWRCEIFNPDGSHNRLAFYTASGHYGLGISSDFDLVKEVIL